MTIATQNLTITLGEKAVVRDATLTFEPGRITAILGPNGAGKTSLVKALAGLTAPTTGSVTLDGAPLPPLAERARRIGYLPQSSVPAWNITVRELVALGRMPHRGRLSAPNNVDTAAVDAALVATNMIQFAARTVDTLSGGERARALFARVLAGAPDWIIVDEPFANLDPPHQRDLAALLKNAARAGAGVIIILHEMNVALHMADDVVVMVDGAVIAAGPAENCLTPVTLSKAFGMAFDLIKHGGKRAIMPRFC